MAITHRHRLTCDLNVNRAAKTMSLVNHPITFLRFCPALAAGTPANYVLSRGRPMPGRMPCLIERREFSSRMIAHMIIRPDGIIRRPMEMT